jgi:hypothetical protein
VVVTVPGTMTIISLLVWVMVLSAYSSMGKKTTQEVTKYKV